MIEIPRPYLRNTLQRLIDECRNTRELKQIQTQIITSPTLTKLDHFFLVTRLLFFCAISESGSLSYATHIFRCIETPNLFVYNTMIRAYSSCVNGNRETISRRSLILYKQMLAKGIAPDNLTFPFLVKECSRWVDADTGQSIHAQVIKTGFNEDLFIQNSIIGMYATCGFLNCARHLFEGMSKRDVVSWNSMIIGHLRCGAFDLAMNLFMRMKERNVITWNSIITGFVQGGQSREALHLFHEMLTSGDDAAKPDKITIASTLSACASLGALDQGKWVHSYLKRSGLECDVVIGTSLVDMYGKCGFVEKAIEIFKEMPQKDVLAWSAMISVFSLHGLGNEAFDLFEEMETEGMKPNHITFVGLLSACAHSGLIDKGRWCFDIMKQVYSIEPQVEHYACMVDILGRAGLFEDAEMLIRSMPIEPDLFVWGGLLGGCQMHGNVELGERVALYLIQLQPLNHVFYVILCDLYAKANRFNDVKRIRALMKERGIKKTVPGCSMIEVNGVVHEFSVRGSPEVVMKEIEWVLNGVCDEAKIAVKFPDISNFFEHIGTW